MTWCFLITMSPRQISISGPYPNVSRRFGYTGCPGYRAKWSRNGRSIHLGTFDTPEAARHAVLIAQAGHLEHKAEICRDMAARYRTVNNAAAAQQDDAQAEKLEAKAARFRTEADELGVKVPS